MTHTIFDPLLPNVGIDKRQRAQEDFGRHLVEQRNQMATIVRKWIETDAKFPIPIYDRMIDRVRQMDAPSRADVASVALLMADQIVTAILVAFDMGDEMRSDGKCVNYAIVAQIREAGSDEVIEDLDVNRGEPVIATWNAYKRWLSRYASSDVRPVASRGHPAEH